MRQVLQHTPQTPLGMPTRNLLEEKIQFYSAAASRLYFDDRSTAQSIVPSDPRSPLSITKIYANGGIQSKG
jgi:GDP-D-mannose dehydratase